MNHSPAYKTKAIKFTEEIRKNLVGLGKERMTYI